MKKLLLLLINLFVLIHSRSFIEFSKRVINGQNAPENEYLWSVLLQGDNPDYKSYGTCGASLIDKQWLVTAAHCFLVARENSLSNKTIPSFWHARAGARTFKTKYGKYENEYEKKINELFEKFYEENADDQYTKRRDPGSSLDLNISKIILHPKYKPDEIEWDIALMKVQSPIEEKYLNEFIEVIPMSSKTDLTPWPEIGQTCILIGWGCKKNDGPISRTAQLANLKIQTNEFCEEVFDQGAGLNDEHELCAGKFKGGHGLCDGDSGSGLACKKDGKWTLAGVASATQTEKPEDFPALFTRVSYFTPWILETIQKE